MRLISCHPVMSMPEYDKDSGKFNEVMLMVEELIASGHKILLFSSFVKHLRLFENHFSEKGLTYSMLTGNTINRKEVINRFQQDSRNKIFLISIKAGGTGLNLTSADYVFILDPWWNPAVEKQAISRAHRIGQNKKVFVYKFITLNTVEEKIFILQHKKADLAEMFLKSANIFHSFTQDEIIKLFD
ncbi:MAG: SWF/SNF helicase family protein [Bacteroidia bacterium]|nr:SWF/SNF helicase family protein [Bacteroidia bacterium]